MAQRTVVARLVYNRLPEIRAALADRADVVVRKTALDAEAKAKSAAPIDTGCLANSIYTATSRGTNYRDPQHIPDARGANPKADLAPDRGPTEKLEAVVSVAASYGIYVEMGTAKMAARPYLGPAAEAVRPSFVAAMKKLFG